MDYSSSSAQQPVRIPPENQNVDDFCFRQSKNKPQINTLLGPMMIMYVSGSHIAWGTATPVIRMQEWTRGTTAAEQTGTILSWYIGALIGSIILVFINHKVPRKTLYIASGAICAVSSVLMIIYPQVVGALVAVRLLAGIAHGLVFVAALLHGAENSLNTMRPQVTSLMQLGILTGIMLTPLFISLSHLDYYNEPFNENIAIGGVNAMFSALAIIYPLIFNYESVVVDAARGEDVKAILNMCRLRREPRENLQLQYDFQEIKAMLDEDKHQNLSPFQEGNSRAMVVVLLTRLLHVLAMNYAINQIRVVMVTPIVTLMYAPSIGLFIRCFAVSIISLYADAAGRKKLLQVSGMVGGASLLVLAICAGVLDGNYMTPGVITLIFDGAVGFGVAYIPDVLMSEAFPMPKKLVSATVATTFEYALQMILIGVLYDINYSNYELPILIISAVLFCVITGALFYLQPNVKANSTLRSTIAAFRSASGQNKTLVQGNGSVE